ncbi:MAG: DNA-binding protein, partial [Candidatus Pacebacteria bacterium]|nr:DNA-binding protein [Candidatus Paceibacterota bacterium]
LKPGQDIKKELEKFITSNNVEAGYILTCVGSLEKAALRLAGEDVVETFDEKFEVVSLVGTLSQDGVHIHISLSRFKDGSVIGGHLKEGCIIHTTAEIVIAKSKKFIFSRKFDEDTGFKELEIGDK